ILGGRHDGVLRVLYDHVHVSGREHDVSAVSLERDLSKVDRTAEQRAACASPRQGESVGFQEFSHRGLPAQYRRVVTQTMQASKDLHRNASAKTFGSRVLGEQVWRGLLKVSGILEGTGAAPHTSSG